MKPFALVFFIFGWVVAKSQTVYYTPSGQKYHTANCRMVKNVSYKTEVNDALEKGLSACKICKPYSKIFGFVSSKKKVSGTDETTQCNGITKSGKRCKHKTRIGNGYCFQHQP